MSGVQIPPSLPFLSPARSMTWRVFHCPNGASSGLQHAATRSLLLQRVTPGPRRLRATRMEHVSERGIEGFRAVSDGCGEIDMAMPKAPQVRFQIDLAYPQAEKIARRLCLTPDQFRDCARRRYARGFPLPDETTGMYDLEGVDRWRMKQRPDLYPEIGFLAPSPLPPSPRIDLVQRDREALEAERQRRAEILSLRRRRS